MASCGRFSAQLLQLLHTVLLLAAGLLRFAEGSISSVTQGEARSKNVLPPAETLRVQISSEVSRLFTLREGIFLS